MPDPPHPLREPVPSLRISIISLGLIYHYESESSLGGQGFSADIEVAFALGFTLRTRAHPQFLAEPGTRPSMVRRLLFGISWRMVMSGTRRSFLQDAALLGAGLFGWSRQATAQVTTSIGGKHAKTPARLSTTPKPPVPVVTPDVADLPFTTGWRRKSVPSDRRAGEAQNRALENSRRLGLQRQLSRPHHSGATRRPRAHPRGKSPARKHFHALAWTRSSHRTGRRPVRQPETDRSRRNIHLRIHRAPGRNLFLSRAQRHAGNDRPDRHVHRASARRSYTPKSITTTASFCRSGRYCQTTPCPTPRAWNSTGSPSTESPRR